MKTFFNPRKSSIIAGVLIILAYSMLGGSNPNARVQGIILEVISGASVIGVALIARASPFFSFSYVSTKDLCARLKLLT